MKKILILFITPLLLLVFTGCQSEKYIYIYPEYPKIKMIPKVRTVTVKVDASGRATAESTKNLFILVKALRRKETYYDNVIFKWNKEADKRNVYAKSHNPKKVQNAKR